MRTAAIIICMLAESVGILALYEIGVILQYLRTMGLVSFAEVHRTVWFTDLALGTLFFSLCYFVAGIIHHVRKLEPKS